MQRKGRRLPPVHPGEILREDLLKPLGISINRLGRDLRVPVNRISAIVNGRRGITAARWTQPKATRTSGHCDSVASRPFVRIARSRLSSLGSPFLRRPDPGSRRPG